MIITKKIKKICMRAISYILILALLVPILTTQVYASTTTYKRTSIVTLKPNKTTDWIKARVKFELAGDKGAPNYFHNQVQTHIRQSEEEFLEGELL